MWLWRALGTLLLGLGAIGLVLPVWPTTIFWIFAALCFARSHPPTRDWIYARPGVGTVIEDFVERGTMSRASKTAALTGMALAGALSTILLWGRWGWIAATLSLIAIGMIYVIRRKEA